MSLVDGIAYCYENITPLQAAMLLSVIFLYVLYLCLRDMDVPPGPRGLPLFGYWPFLKAETCHLQLQELSRKYGDVFSFRITGRLFIHLGSLKAVKEALLTKSEYFVERPSGESVLSIVFKDSMALVNGEPWKALRKFFISKFKEYGMNAIKENAASSVYDGLKEAVEELHDTKSRPIQITDLITLKTMMIIRRIMFNDQGITKAELQELNDMYSEIMKGLSSKNLLLVGNVAKYFVLPLMPCSWTMKKCNKRIETILFDVVNRHKSEYSESQVADLIDCYFKERDDRRRKGDPTAAYFTDKALVSSLSQFVTDGVLTIGVFIGNFLMTLVDYPDEQDKIYEEILEVIGPDRLPTLEDKNKLPYTNAFICEVTRFTDFFPIFPSVESAKDTTLQDYKIPQGSILLINMYGCNRNPHDFENPDEFNPSRYLPKQGQPRPDLPIMFGIGKRACIGEAFSMIQTFLFVTTIVQNFRLSYPEGSRGSSMFSAAERIKICAFPRSHKSDEQTF